MLWKVTRTRVGIRREENTQPSRQGKRVMGVARWRGGDERGREWWTVVYVGGGAGHTGEGLGIGQRVPRKYTEFFENLDRQGVDG